MAIHRLEKKKVIEFPNQVEENPVVSVIVLTHNHETYIKQCLDSILSQVTTFPYEIIVGEDESSDGTRSICEDYAIKYPENIRLFLHHRENNIAINGKPTGRFNFLYSLHIAKGKYIAMCDGDDYWTDNSKLQKQVDFLETHGDASFCHHAFHVLQEGGLQVKWNRNELNRKKPVLEFEDMLEFPYPKILTVMFRRAVLEPYDLVYFLIDNRVGDIPFWHLLLLQGKGYFLDADMGCYRSNPGGVTNALKEDLAILEAKIQILERILNSGIYHSPSLLREYLVKHYTARFVQLGSQADFRSALKHKLRSSYRFRSGQIKNQITIPGLVACYFKKKPV